MKIILMMSLRTLSTILVFLLLVLFTALPASAETETDSATIFLVRHAEKVEPGDDPELTEIGQQRALALAFTLKDADIERIYSTDYKRTLATATPFANLVSLPIDVYDPQKLSELAESLLQSRQNTLVVGHSNTTPEMVELLGGDPGTEIDEKSEYDRLYVVTIGPNGVSSVLLRYGQL